MIGVIYDRRGYATGFTIIISLVLITAVYLSINTGKYFYEQNYTETAADSIAISLATWESRGLNTLATLNYGMVRSIHCIRLVLFLWAASIAVALSGNPSLFFQLSKRAPQVIRKLWSAGVRFSKTAKKIKKTIPFLVLGCYRKLLIYYGIKGVIYPSLPLPGKKTGPSLRLQVKDGEPLTIGSIIREAKGRARSHKPKNRFKRLFYRVLMKIFFSRMQILLGLRGDIIPQVTEEDFDKKQFVCFFGNSGTKKPYLDTLFKSSYRNYAVSCAKPWGGSSYEATWKSKRIMPGDKTVKKFLMGERYDL